jgi:hypothetical protein
MKRCLLTKLGVVGLALAGLIMITQFVWQFAATGQVFADAPDEWVAPFDLLEFMAQTLFIAIALLIVGCLADRLLAQKNARNQQGSK